MREGERGFARPLKQQPPFQGSTNTKSTGPVRNDGGEARGMPGTQKRQRGPHKERYQKGNTYHTPFRVLEVPATLTGPPEMGEEAAVPAQPHHSDSLWSHRHFYLPPLSPQSARSGPAMGCAPHHTPFNSDWLCVNFLEMRPSKRPLWFSGCNLCQPLPCLRCPQAGGWGGGGRGVLYPSFPSL